MTLHELTPYELGEMKHSDSVDYLAIYLTKGSDNDKRLAASALKKLIESGIKCDKCTPFLIQNLSSKKPQVRQYTLKTLQLLTIPADFKEHLYNCYVQEDKDYNLVLLKDILSKLPDFNEIELANHTVIQNITKQNKEIKEAKRGFIYFLEESFAGTIKIGKTNNLKERMNNFGVKLPFDVELIHFIESENAAYTEKLFHIHFEDRRINGEWFALSEEDMKWIREGQLTSKLRTSIGNPENPLSSNSDNPISKKQVDYLIHLLTEFNYPLNYPIHALTSSQASHLIQLILNEQQLKKRIQ